MMTSPTIQDVLVLGGGPAGLSASLYLGRARKTVTVLDAGSPRHAVSKGVHNFLTRDGMSPAELRTQAWSQMEAYPSVRRVVARVTALQRDDERWVAHTERGEAHSGRTVVLSTGVVDEHPNIPGFAERWGHAIHHCPYCHGWEMRDLPLAVLAGEEAAGHLAPLLLGWSSDVVVLTHGAELSASTRSVLDVARIPVFESPVVRLEGEGRGLERVVLEDGTTLARRGLFVASPQHQVPLVDGLGLELNEQGYVVVDDFGATSVPGIWAAGDVTSRAQQVIEAAAQGAKVAVAINAALTMGDSPTRDPSRAALHAERVDLGS
ncbi:MAG: NAD(P)/FAD-dependent oxidoreductase [Myxococcota bacterium]